MNLNQAAHGDREFGYIQSRLGVAAQDRRRPRRVDPVVAGRIGTLGARRARPARAAPAAAGPLRRQHARRRGHRGRQGRGRSCGSASRSTPTASTTWSPWSTQVADDDVDKLVDRVRRHLPASRPSCCPAASGTSRCATAPGIELGLRTFLDRRRLRRVHHELRGPRRPAPAARPGRAAADGRRLRLRRRGRLEDLGAAARRSR